MKEIDLRGMPKNFQVSILNLFDKSAYHEWEDTADFALQDETSFYVSYFIKKDGSKIRVVTEYV